ncbi:hypothetical protein BDV19DRAFT_362028 [Aspergillus venezuelensis]
MVGRKWSKFFPRPADWVSSAAPLSARKQVYLPNFTIALMRTPFLPPRYASFYVPLWFSKLDMRDYMQRLYGVSIISIRSYVEQQKVTRMKRGPRQGYGQIRRPKSRKRMTIEMKDPFVWPETPKNMEAWENDQFHKAAKFQKDVSTEASPQHIVKELKEDEFDTVDEEAKKLITGEKPWRPTWQALGLNYDRPSVGKPPLPGQSGSSSGSNPSS